MCLFGSMESICVLFNIYLFNFEKKGIFLPKLNLLGFKNFFLKKLWATRKSVSYIYFSSYGSSIHYPLNKLKLWDNYVHFILKCKLIPDIRVINRFLLKNIFLKMFQDLSLWFEIEKMINSSLIGFANEFIVRIYNL